MLNRFPVERHPWVVWAIAGLIAFVLLGISIGNHFSFSLPFSGNAVSQPGNVPQPATVPPPVVAEKETPTPTPVPKFAFAGALGLMLLRDDSPLPIAYGIGWFGDKPDGNFLEYKFPLFVSKDRFSYEIRLAKPEILTTLTTIPDPDLKEIGTSWETEINDPENDFTFKVKLTKTGEVQRYNVDFLFSPDEGETWSLQTHWPPPKP